jgi:class 3 adenylate cyclase
MRFHRRLAVKITALAVFLVVVTITYSAVISYRRERRDLEERFGLALERIVATAALSIDGDAHQKLQRREDAALPEFQALQRYLRQVQEANYLRPDLLYSFHLEQDGSLRFAVMLQERVYTGDRYDPVPQNAGQLMYTAMSGNASHTKLYEDEHGHWLSAYAAIRDSGGKVVGILEADYDISLFQAELHEELRWLLLSSGSAVLLAILLSVFMARSVAVALQRIREGAEAIEHERYDHRIALRREDELGLVARQFNRTAEVLSERFHMLKFLPRHTLEAIKRRAQDGEGIEAERVFASIFFSDIRGYTKMSAGLSDERVVRMLNTYLRRQAEIIEEHGGTIDKFIGDAVLAVFTGAEHQARAVRAALAIQAAVAEMNEQKAFEREVHLGIGLAAGELVLGEVGSEGRRERTIIGSVVNLASRLCSRAGADEVVISENLRAGLGEAVSVSASEKVELKGFPEAQLCHTVGSLRAAA